MERAKQCARIEPLEKRIVGAVCRGVRGSTALTGMLTKTPITRICSTRFKVLERVKVSVPYKKDQGSQPSTLEPHQQYRALRTHCLTDGVEELPWWNEAWGTGETVPSCLSLAAPRVWWDSVS